MRKFVIALVNLIGFTGILPAAQVSLEVDSIGSSGFLELNRENGTHSLTGGGLGVYWCLDECGFAKVPGGSPEGDFTFTVRMKNVSFNGSGTAGILVKPDTRTHSPNISLRWDSYWKSRNGSGLAWFNRMTDPEIINPNNGALRKGCKIGYDFPCYGYALENQVDGFSNKENMWFRVVRIKMDDKSIYRLFARTGDEGDFVEITPQTSDLSPCHSPVSPFRYPHFMLPESPASGKVELGVYVAGTTHREKVFAQFDHISLVEESLAPPSAVIIPKHPGGIQSNSAHPFEWMSDTEFRKINGQLIHKKESGPNELQYLRILP